MAQKPPFDPNAPVTPVNTNSSPLIKPPYVENNGSTFAGRIAQGAVENLPAIGGLAGGLIGGGTTFGTGTIAGGAAGAMAGQGLKDFIKALQNQNFQAPTAQGTINELGNIATAGAKEALNTAIGGKIASTIGKGLAYAGKTLAPEVATIVETAEKPTAQAIKDAAQSLGVTPTKGMLNSSPIVQGIENSLEESPTLAGSLVRRETDKIREKIQNALTGVLEGSKEKISPYEVGTKIQQGIVAKINKAVAPVKEAYEKLDLEMPYIDLTNKSKEMVARNLLNLGDAQLLPNSQAGSAIKEFAEGVARSNTAQDLEVLLSNAKGRLRAEVDPNVKAVYSQIIDKLDRMQTSNIIRAAARNAPSPEEGFQIAKSLTGDIKQTRAAYKDVMTGLRDLFDNSGMKIPDSPRNAIAQLENLTPEQITNKLWKENNVGLLRYLSEKFPEELQHLRTLRLSEVLSDSKRVVNGREIIDPIKLTKIVQEMPPEVTDIVFGASKNRIIEDVATLAKNFPAKINPSGTGKKWEFDFDLTKLSTWTQGLERYVAYRLAANPITGRGIQSVGTGLQTAADVGEPLFREIYKVPLRSGETAIQRRMNNAK